MEFHSQLRKRLIVNFLVWIVFVTVGFGLFIFNGWRAAVNNAGEQSADDVAVTSLILKQSIVDGSKLLDLIKRDIAPIALSKTPTQEQFEKTLNRSLAEFSVHFDISNYGILYLIDKEGDLIARSDRKSLAKVNLSDRYFFKKLKSDPNKLFVVSSMIKSRTTNKSIVSLVTPFKNSKGEFIGALGLQIDPAPLEALLGANIHQREATITVVSENNEIVLAVPLSAITPNSDSGIPFKDVALFEQEANGEWNVFDGQIIARKFIPEINIRVISQISVTQVRKKFIRKNIEFFSFLFVMAAIFTILFFLLNRKILEADDARLHSMLDGLTGLPNRRAFDENYEKFLKDARRNKHPVSVLFIDIDHFKRCNDEYGHENGDIVLKAVARLVQKCMHRPLDFCCRWGGEEMVCLLPDSDLDGAAKLAEIILREVSQEPILINEFPPIHVTVSIGIASASHDNALLENNLVDKADQAMYRAKQNGRNCYSA